MKQRLRIAQALMEHPKLLILDAMNGLNNEGVSLIRDILISLKEKGVTILLASHNSDDISILFDSIYVMDNGILEEKLQ